jgi:hypothetical protein
MDSSVLVMARGMTGIAVALFIVCLGERRRRGLPLFSQWIVWFTTILLMNVAIQWMPGGFLRTTLVALAWALFLVFLPGFLKGASKDGESEAACLITGIVVARYRAGCPVIRIDCIDRDGRSHLVYQCRDEKASDVQ